MPHVRQCGKPTNYKQKNYISTTGEIDAKKQHLKFHNLFNIFSDQLFTPLSVLDSYDDNIHILFSVSPIS